MVEPWTADERAKLRMQALRDIGNRVLLAAILVTMPLWFLPGLLIAGVRAAWRDSGRDLLLSIPQAVREIRRGGLRYSALRVLINPNIVKRVPEVQMKRKEPNP